VIDVSRQAIKKWVKANKRKDLRDHMFSRALRSGKYKSCPHSSSYYQMVVFIPHFLLRLFCWITNQPVACHVTLIGDEKGELVRHRGHFKLPARVAKKLAAKEEEEEVGE